MLSLRVHECYFDRVALPHANEGRGHFAIEGPIAISCAACGIERTDEFLGGESHLHYGRCAVPNRRWQIAGVTNDVRSFDRLGYRVRVRRSALSACHNSHCVCPGCDPQETRCQSQLSNDFDCNVSNSVES